MNVLHLITSMGVNWGGPALTTLLTVRGLRNKGVNATLLTYDVLPPDRPISKEPFIITLSSLLPCQRMAGWSLEMKHHVENSKADMYHIQGLWQYPGYVAAAQARKREKPYLITLRGQLYPQALALSALKKRIALRLYQKKQLQHASCIHATCEEEYRYYRELGFTNPVAVIPNPIDCNQYPVYGRPDGVKRVGYLGRIHPRKNIHRLIEAWGELHETEGELVVMGEGDKSYMKKLQDQVKQMGLTNVVFTGFVGGEEKQRLLASLSCLVVPSDFENFGMIVPEALLQCVPVIVSKGAPWEIIHAHSCGWWVDNDVRTLKETIREALSLDEEVRQEMGERGRELIVQNYSVEIVASRMKQVYNWITGNAFKPDFVFLD